VRFITFLYDANTLLTNIRKIFFC